MTVATKYSSKQVIGIHQM